MTTSGSYSFTVNRGQIIRDALMNIGQLDQTEAPTAQETTDIALKLNMLVKQWQGKSDFTHGLKVFTRRRGYLFLKNTVGPYVMGPTSTTGWTTDTPKMPTTTVAKTTGAGSITVSSATGLATNMRIGIELDSGALFWTTISGVAGSVVSLNSTLPSASASGSQVFAFTTIAQRPIQVSAVVLRDEQSTDQPLRFLRTAEDYDFLTNKADPQNIGDPTAVYIENQTDYSYLYTDIAIAQDVAKYLVVTFMEPVQDLNQDSDTFEYPQEWYLALSWGLAKQIAPMFGAAWTQSHQSNYNDALAIAGHKDAEVNSMYFQRYGDE